MDPAVSLREVGVFFHLPRQGRYGPIPRMLGADRVLWGIDDITLDVARGKVLGLIGPNGAGKTTLLRTIAGVFVPDRGTVEVQGRITPLLSFSAGLKPGLTGWQNIRLASVLLGDRPRAARDRAEAVAALADIGDFIDAPARTYSTGMRARLGFAICVSATPDVLLVDEAITVGDETFQTRSQQRIAELVASGTTVIMASHNLAPLAEQCDTLVRLDRGRIVDRGAPLDVIDRYRASLRDQEQDAALAPASPAAVPPARPRGA